MTLQYHANGFKPQTRNSPVIVGDHYELAETVAAGYGNELLGGLLAKTDSQPALVSMSGYQKFQNDELNDYSNGKRPSQSYATLADYNASRPVQESMYLTYALPGTADPELQPPSTAYVRNADQLAYGASSIDQSRAPYEATNSVYTGFQAGKLPEVSSYHPPQGSEACHLSIYLDSTFDLFVPSPLTAYLMFATRRVPATLTRLELRENDAYYKYMVDARAPSFAETGSPNGRVHLRLQLQEGSGIDAGLIDVGPWLYEDSRQIKSRTSSDASRKRRMTGESLQPCHLAKRGTPPRQQTGESQQFGSCEYVQGSSTAYPQGLQSVDRTSMQRKLTPYGRSQSQRSLQDNNSPISSHSYLGSVGSSYSVMRPPSTQTSAWSPYNMAHRPGASPVLSTQSFSTSATAPNPANPPLVRASTLQTPSGSASASGNSSSDGAFNPYAHCTNRAIIKIRGDLNTMQDGWSSDERAAKRRLVLFRGEQSGSTIHTYFRSVKPDERPSSHAVRERRVSCIYWEEREEYFVTSVDTIALLETLVGARFTVEEKNRIRRNLETHHPLTVSKGKPDTESFFKVIMGFPNPKPRNIEKDVKVFPWPILAQALRKVISKYSASFASTAGPLTTSRSQTYARAHSEHNSEPYLSSGSSTSSTTRTLKSVTLSPPTATPHGLPQHSQASSLSYTVPTLASQYPNHDAARPLTLNHTVQASMPEFSHAYTSSSVGRRRSSDASTGMLGSSAYVAATTRPRANTSFASLYATQDATIANDWQLPTAGQPVRGSWDFSSYLQPDSGSLSQDYRRESMSKAEQGAVIGGYHRQQEVADRTGSQNIITSGAP